MAIYGTTFIIFLFFLIILYLGVKWRNIYLTVIALLLLFVVPIKFVESPQTERRKQDRITFNRHQTPPQKEKVEKLPYEDRMKQKDKELENHSIDKFNQIMEKDE